MCYLFSELLDFRVVCAVEMGVRDYCDCGCGYFHHLVCNVRKLVQVHGLVSRGQDHPNVGREPLEEELAEKGVGIS